MVRRKTMTYCICYWTIPNIYKENLLVARYTRLSDLVWLGLGPLLQPGEHAVIALNDPVLLDGEGLDFGGSDGHAETDLQNPAA